MKRFHVHVAVDDLEANLRFYSAVFGSEPTVRKPDYARSMVEDPRINFVISQRGAKAGVDHLPLQVDSDNELQALREQAGAAEIAAFHQPDATRCYARSDKYWLIDPQGIAWETYRTLGELYGADTAKMQAEGACCAPRPATVAVAAPAPARAKCC